MQLTMESSNSGSSSKHEPVDGQLVSTQLEALALFRRLVDLVASDATIEIHNLQEVGTLVMVRTGELTVSRGSSVS